MINEAELIKLMEERADLKYVTDIMPVANEEFAAKFAGRYFSTPKKMGAQTAEANINAGIAAAKQIVGFLKDGCEKRREMKNHYIISSNQRSTFRSGRMNTILPFI